MKRDRIIYWGATGLFSLIMMMSIGMYLFSNNMASQSFTLLGYPTYLIYMLAFAKTMGLIAILSKKSKVLKEWAYAGFTFNLILAIVAHLHIGDGEFAPALVALLLIAMSYLYDRKLYH